MLKIEGNVDGREFLQLGVSYKEIKEEIGIIGYRAKDCKPSYAEQTSLWKPKIDKAELNKNVMRH